MANNNKKFTKLLLNHSTIKISKNPMKFNLDCLSMTLVIFLKMMSLNMKLNMKLAMLMNQIMNNLNSMFIHLKLILRISTRLTIDMEINTLLQEL